MGAGHQQETGMRVIIVELSLPDVVSYETLLTVKKNECHYLIPNS